METRDETEPGRVVKPIVWVASSLRDLRKFPKAVRTTFGQALYDAQTGGKHPHAKPLKGFGGAGVLEVVDDHDGDTYGAVYTVRFAGAVYVLHVFEKKSKAGIRTAAADIEKIRSRLKEAEKHFVEWRKTQKGKAEDHG